MKPIKAYAGEDYTVIYEYDDGKVERWSGGTRSWRNNNPGNVINNKIEWKGKIGHAGGFCVFDSYEMGRRAVIRILTTKGNRGLTLAEGIYEYAPPEDNNPTEKYIKHISKETGIHRDTLLKLLEHRIPDIFDVIQKHESYVVGDVTTVHLVDEEPKSDSKKEGAYIWRTEGDADVRPEHAMRDGQIFNWDNPPKGGHPGEDYGCRCTAELLQENLKGEIYLEKLFS